MTKRAASFSTVILRRTAIFVAAALALLFSACGKKTAAELAEEERAKIREEKRTAAVKALKDLETQFPSHPKAKEAPAKAAALNAAAPKK